MGRTYQNLIKAGETLRIAGLMGGTSMDGLDICITDLSVTAGLMLHANVLAGRVIPFPQALREQIRGALEGSAAEICALSYDLGRWYAEELKRFVDMEDIQGLELIAAHGQTLHHIPGHSTLQVLETSFLQQRFSVPVVHDFRAADIAAGGEGAPLMPWVDAMLYAQMDRGRILLNLGGVSNISAIPARDAGEKLPLLGYDTGPGMALLDEYFLELTGSPFDGGGAEADRGRVDEKLLQRFLQHPYLGKKAPKSTGRDMFGLPWFRMHGEGLNKLSLPDALATLAAFTAESVAVEVKRHAAAYSVEELTVSGGGLHHRTLMSELRNRCGGLRVEPLPERPVASDLKESFGMAVLGYAHAAGLPVDLRSVTGAAEIYIPGKK